MTVRAAFIDLGVHHVTATSLAAGPWSDQACHGGAPGALVTRAAEALPTLVPMEVARVTCELLRPVPVGPLEVAAEIVREGKKIQLAEVRVRAAGIDVVRAIVLRTRVVEQPELATLYGYEEPIPAFEEGVAENSRVPDRFASLFAMRTVKGSFREKGPAALWFRLDGELFEGERASPASRALAVADFSNGISTLVAFDECTFLNADLTVNLARQPVGEVLLVDARTLPGGGGRAVAQSRLGDRYGWFGSATQSLLIERRTDAQKGSRRS